MYSSGLVISWRFPCGGEVEECGEGGEEMEEGEERKVGGEMQDIASS